MATLPAGGSAFGDISSAPGRRDKAQNDTSLSQANLVALANQPPAYYEDLIDARGKADKTVEAGRIGRASSIES